MLKKLVLAAAVTFAATSAFAQQYPTKPIQMVVPFSAGGPTDVVARSLAQAMTKSIGGTIVVDNKPGAGGTLGAELIKNAQPDGHMLLLHHIGMATAPALYRSLRFNPLNDYEYIGLVVDVPMVLVGKKDLPPQSFKDLLPYLKTNAQKLNLANAGIGSASHLCGLLFMSMLETDLTTVPYKGAAPAMTDVQGGQVDLLCDQTTNTTQPILTGRVKAYGTATKERLSVLPNVPTLAEQGLPNFEVAVWHGLYAPKNTPKPVVDKLVKGLQDALNDAAFKDSMAKLGAIPMPAARATPDALRTHLKTETDKWTPVIKKAGVYAD